MSTKPKHTPGMPVLRLVKRDSENTPFEYLDAEERDSTERLGFTRLTLDTAEGYTIAEVCDNEDYAARIVACVNACEGIARPEGLRALIEAAQYAVDLICLREEGLPKEQRTDAYNLKRALAALSTTEDK